MEATYHPAYELIRKHGFEKTTPRVLKRRRDDGTYDVLFFNEDEYTVDLWISKSKDIWDEPQVVATLTPMYCDSDFVYLTQQFPACIGATTMALGAVKTAGILTVMVLLAIVLPGEWKAVALFPACKFFFF